MILIDICKICIEIVSNFMSSMTRRYNAFNVSKSMSNPFDKGFCFDTSHLCQIFNQNDNRLPVCQNYVKSICHAFLF